MKDYMEWFKTSMQLVNDLDPYIALAAFVHELPPNHYLQIAISLQSNHDGL